MDLGLEGRSALVCASSRGLGFACAMELARAGARVIVNGRDLRRVEAAAQRISDSTGAVLTAIAADLESAADRASLLSRAGTIDILINNNGGPPAADFRIIDEESLYAGIHANMIVPIELMRHVVDGMVERRFGRIVNITSSSVKMPLPGLDLSSGSRAGLTAFAAGVARSVAYANVTINGLLPGPFETERIEALLTAGAQASGKDVEEVRLERQRSIPARRFGNPREFGKACAFLCSADAGFITGQNLLMDGGAFPGIF